MTVETGSFNFTKAAETKNSENAVVIWNIPKLAESFLEHWQDRWNRGGLPFQLLNTDRQRRFLFKETDLSIAPGQLANVAGIAPAKSKNRNISKIKRKQVSGKFR